MSLLLAPTQKKLLAQLRAEGIIESVQPGTSDAFNLNVLCDLGLARCTTKRGPGAWLYDFRPDVAAMAADDAEKIVLAIVPELMARIEAGATWIEGEGQEGATRVYLVLGMEQGGEVYGRILILGTTNQTPEAADRIMGRIARVMDPSHHVERTDRITFSWRPSVEWCEARAREAMEAYEAEQYRDDLTLAP